MKHSIWRRLGVATLGLSPLMSANALAQDTTLESVTPQSAAVIDNTQGEGQTFLPAYFERYAPRTALDMVRQVPGFQINQGDNKRGLGQGGANILINGQRLTGKSNPDDQLGRISAPNVVKIEIVDGTSLDIPGLSGQVANVTTKNTGITGTWEWNPEWRARLQARILNGEATVSGETGNLGWSIKVQNITSHQGNRGQENLFTPDGEVFETRYETRRGDFQSFSPSVDLKWSPTGDRTANLNLEYNHQNFDGRGGSNRTALTELGNSSFTQSINGEDERNGSIGGDYEFPFLQGKLKTIGYYRFEDSPSKNVFEIYEFGDLIDSSVFIQDAFESESIARTEYSWSPKDGQDWQLGVEGALNILNIDQEFLSNDASVFIDQNSVEEKRAEVTLTHSRKLSPKLDLQVSVGGEYSEIAQTSDFTAAADENDPREFIRPKGFVTTTYKPDDSLSIRAKVEREVGQLSFFDFISSVDLENDLGREGNPNLVPSQTWNFTLEFDKDFGDGNTFKIEFYDNEISDIVDRIPIGDDGDAVGNLDKARRYGFDINTTLKGDKWGLKGTQLDFKLDYRWSELDDPLTGIQRRLNGDKVFYWSAEFRHDIQNTDWAYGIAADRFRRARSFQLTTVNQFDNSSPLGRAYIEHKDVFGLKVRGELLNLFDTRDNFRREFFVDPDDLANGQLTNTRRDQGVLGFTEASDRGSDMFFRASVSGTF